MSADVTWDVTYQFVPNDFDFPALPMWSVAAQPDMPFTDIQTFLMGVYASPVGCLQSYFERNDGTIAPTISHPDVGYAPDTNFFDPDNYISVSAMMYSGDAYLLNEVRKVR